MLRLVSLQTQTRGPGWSTGRGLEHILQNKDEREEAEVGGGGGTRVKVLFSMFLT